MNGEFPHYLHLAFSLMYLTPCPLKPIPLAAPFSPRPPRSLPLQEQLCHTLALFAFVEEHGRHHTDGDPYAWFKAGCSAFAWQPPGSQAAGGPGISQGGNHSASYSSAAAAIFASPVPYLAGSPLVPASPRPHHCFPHLHPSDAEVWAAPGAAALLHLLQRGVDGDRRSGAGSRRRLRSGSSGGSATPPPSPVGGGGGGGGWIGAAAATAVLHGGSSSSTWAMAVAAASAPVEASREEDGEAVLLRRQTQALATALAWGDAGGVGVSEEEVERVGALLAIQVGVWGKQCEQYAFICMPAGTDGRWSNSVS